MSEGAISAVKRTMRAKWRKDGKMGKSLNRESTNGIAPGLRKRRSGGLDSGIKRTLSPP